MLVLYIKWLNLSIVFVFFYIIVYNIFKIWSFEMDYDVYDLLFFVGVSFSFHAVLRVIVSDLKGHS